MFVQQISVFLENRPGSLESFTQLLGAAGIDMLALCVADTTDFGILRAITSNNKNALELAKSSGYTASLTEVLALAVKDAPGGLHGALALLSAGGVSIEYLYSFVRRMGQDAIIIIRVSAPQKAAEILQSNGIRLLSEQEIQH